MAPKINPQIERTVKDLEDLTDIIAAAASESANEVIRRVAEHNEFLDGDLYDRLFKAVDLFEGTAYSLDQKIANALNELISPSEVLYTRTVSEFNKGLDRQQASLLEVMDSYWDDVLKDLETQEQRYTEYVDSTTDKITKEILGTLESIETTSETTKGTILNAITDIAKVITGDVSPIIERSEDVVSTLREVLPDTIEALPKLFGDALGASLNPLFGGISTMLDLFSKDEWEKSFSQGRELMEMLENDPHIGRFFKTLLPGGVWFLSPIALAAITAIAMSLATAGVQSALAAPLEQTRQESFKMFRPTLIAPTEIRELQNRGDIEPSDAEDQLKQWGYSDEKIEQISHLRKQLLNVGEILSLWRRGEIQPPELDERFAALGIVGDDQKHMRTLAFMIPSVRDIIQFGVREVFDLDLALRFGQLEGLTPAQVELMRSKFTRAEGGVEGTVQALVEYAKQSGLSEEWALAYWAAHWRLPSVTSLFEMVHRLAPDIVDAKSEDFIGLGLNPSEIKFELKDLDTQLRAADYTPAFRDRLTAISYRPLTRVDIRRMHRLGLLTEDEVTLRYRELGFSPGDAALMTSFTVSYNKQPDANLAQETKDITRSQILNFYQDGHLSRDEALTSLETVGYSSNIAEWFIASKDLDILEKVHRAKIKAIQEQFDAREIDYNQAVVQFDELNLPALQRDAILSDIVSKQRARVRTPTPTQLKDMGEEGIISRSVYVSTLRGLGYSKIWAERLSQIVDFKPVMDIDSEEE